jgi:two-component system, chemotaxis family, protein-glutamate methylesterase/glutaminase
MIRCLVVDDSRAFRAILRAILSQAQGVEVVGEAGDGDDAVAKVLALRPDVVTMDVRMPGKDGLGAIADIMERAPTPIVVVSAEGGPERQGIAFEALQLGAIEVLGKPRSDGAGRFERDAQAIRMAVRAVSGLKLVTRHRRHARRAAAPIAPVAPVAPVAPSRPAPKVPAPTPVRCAPTLIPGTMPVVTYEAAPWASPGAAGVRGADRVLGIAASTGGPAALARILAGLPADYPLPILIVQHIAQGFEDGLVHWLAGETSLRVKLASDGEALAAATVFIAPDGRHMGIVGGRIRLWDGAPIRGFRPSGTVLFQSLATACGPGAAGLVLSGMGDDGADGLQAVRARGGWTAAQGPATSIIYGMPRAAIERGAAAETLELEEIPAALVRIARRAEAATP